MNKQNFTVQESFPVSSQTLDFMQDQINFVSELALQFGYNAILRQPTSSKSGLCIFKGELMELKYTNVTISYYIVQEENITINAHGTTYTNARIKRYVVGANTYAGAVDHVAASSMNDMTLTIPCQMPKGAIIMWNGTIVPDGWALCNGQTSNGVTTPDLRGRFIVGYNPNDTDYDTIGETGGEKTHTLTVAEMPSHSHSYTITTGNNDDVKHSGYDSVVSLNLNSTLTGSTGGNQAHENCPPYYTLAYIMKVK